MIKHRTIAEGSQAIATDILNSLSSAGHLEFADSTELTIAAGVVTVTQTFHRVDTAGGAATDDLDTINGRASDGAVIFLRAENDARTVVIKHNTGNILCNGNMDFILDDAQDFAVLIFSADLAKWCCFGKVVSGLYLYDRENSTVTVTGVGEGTLYSKAIAANDLGTNRGLRLTIVGTHTVNAGSTQTIRVKLGVTTVFTINYGGAIGNGTYALKIVVEMFNTAANAQRWHYWTQATLGAPATSLIYNTSAEDTTAARTLLVSEQSNDAAGSVTKTIAFLEFLQ